MKASELIKKLQDIIKEKGNLEIIVSDGYGNPEILEEILVKQTFYYNHIPLDNDPRDMNYYIELRYLKD